MSVREPLRPKISISAYSEHQEGESEDQYYVFHAPDDTRRSLHVIDADYGVFESSDKQKKKNILLSPKNLIKKLKVSNTINNDFTALPNGGLNLRAEPELIDSIIPRNKTLLNSTSRNRRSQINSKKYYNVDSGSEDEYDDDFNDNVSCRTSSSGSLTSASSSEIGKRDKFEKYYKSQYKIPSLADSNQLKSSKNSSPKSSKLNKLNILRSSKMDALVVHNTNPDCTRDNDDYIIQKSRVELEYEMMKMKVARYQAERDAMKIKMKRKEISNKLRDYEYYCVNGITHKRKLKQLQEGNNSNSNSPYYQIEYPQNTNSPSNSSSKYKSRRQIQQKSQRSSTIADNDFFGKISQLLPDEVLKTLEPYEPFIPTLKQVQKFHNETFSWLKCIPIISILSLLVGILGLFIPKNSTRPWSVRALIVAFLDLAILATAGFSIYLSTLYIYRFFNAFYFMARLLRIV